MFSFKTQDDEEDDDNSEVGEDEEEEDEDGEDDEEEEEEENHQRYDFRQRKTVVLYQAPLDGTASVQRNPFNQLLISETCMSVCIKSTAF